MFVFQPITLMLNTCLQLAFLFTLLSVSACVAQESTKESIQQTSFHVQNQIAVERGKPNKFVDGVGWVLGIPSKLILWNRDVNNHDVSQETQNDLVKYMQANGLTSTKVRINQYNPGDDWRRLVQNKKVGAGWRYTVGVLYTFGETILPGRLVGGDHYNPFTDTAHVYSDIPVLAMEQSAYAKDVHSRDFPGTYATFQEFPLIGLWSERKSKDDVIAYVDYYGDPQEKLAARKVLHPQYGAEIGSEIGSLVPPAQPITTITGAAVGHAVGWIKGEEAVEQARYRE